MPIQMAKVGAGRKGELMRLGSWRRNDAAGEMAARAEGFDAGQLEELGMGICGESGRH